MNILLAKDNKKYAGKYVATKSFKDRKVIAFGSSLISVYNTAKKKGAQEPVVFFVPQKDTVHIY